MKTLKDFDLERKKILIRCDFNVPLGDKGDILDDFRIQQILPTINYLLGNKTKIILMSHLDDPDGKVVEGLRLSQVQKRLEELLNIKVVKSQNCIGKETEKRALEMGDGEILLLENLRFHKEEEEGNLDFAKEISKLGEIYINDAFGACHRAHASITGIPKFLPHGAGLLLEKEIKNLDHLLEKAEKPMVAIIAGKKVETKTKVIDRISDIADIVLIGGLIQKELKEKNIQLKNPQKIIGPVDEVGGGLDIGPKTVAIFREKILTAKTIFWNGVLGKIEEEQFSKGTEEIARAIIESNAFSVAGGGETVEFIRKFNLLDKFAHVSTGGGAMLSFISGEKLPGISALEG